MALNLGLVDIKVEEEDQASFEDLYIDWMEADQHAVNLLNAIEIAVRAKRTQSNECMEFAQKLLGCSCEVITSGDSGKLSKSIFKAANQLNNVVWSLKRTLEAYYSKDIKNKPAADVKINISKLLIKAGNNATADAKSFSVGHITGLQIDHSAVSTTVEKAAFAMHNALTVISKSVQQFRNDESTKSEKIATGAAMRKAVKDNKKHGVLWNNDNGDMEIAGNKTAIEMYMRCRKVYAAILTDVRKAFKEIKIAVQKSKKPAHANFNV